MITNTDHVVASSLTKRINDAHASGTPVLVNGRKARSSAAHVANVWGNGTVSVDVEGRRLKHKTDRLWIKQGDSFALEIKES